MKLNWWKREQKIEESTKKKITKKYRVLRIYDTYGRYVTGAEENLSSKKDGVEASVDALTLIDRFVAWYKEENTPFFEFIYSDGGVSVVERRVIARYNITVKLLEVEQNENV